MILTIFKRDLERDRCDQIVLIKRLNKQGGHV